MIDTNFFTVGGCVRDELLGLTPKDIDFAVEAPSFDDMIDALDDLGVERFLTTPEFFTARGRFAKKWGDNSGGPFVGEAVDFVLCRKDGPTRDGRRPEFVEVGTILDDLARRDFTVNAMARKCLNIGWLQPLDTVIDPHNGTRDLADRVLRFVGDPSERLAEDALRAFRAVRFKITKNFAFVGSTIEAIRAMEAQDFAAVSTERIREELHRCFMFDTVRTLQVLANFPTLLDLALFRGIKFKPTLEAS